MKAALCKRLDGPEALVIEEVPVPEPGAGEVRLAVRAAALNFFDTLITRGKYQTRPELPFSPSGEVAGVVDAVGPGVTGIVPGRRYQAYLGYGGAREQVVVEPWRLVAIPDGVSDEVAAGVSITYGTAIHGLKDRAGLKPGEWIAVLGAAGGAGLAAVEIARLMGARVIAVAAGADKLAVCRTAGAEVTIDYTSGDLKEALREATGGAGVDVVYDCVGGAHAEPALRATAWGGRFLVVGFASGEIPRLPLNLLLLKGAAMIGVFWGESVRRDPAGHRANMAAVLQWVAEGRLLPVVHACYPLARIRDAIGEIESRSAKGKVVLTMGQAPAA